MKQLEVVGVRVEMPTNQPIVLLKESYGSHYLPIWIGAVEATAIAFAQQGLSPARPLTHDLMKEVIEALGQQLQAVHIVDLREGVFYAKLLFTPDIEIPARPSDAIALALRTGADIFVDDKVLNQAGITIADEQEDEVEKFRQFLDHVSPEDFGSGGQAGPQ